MSPRCCQTSSGGLGRNCPWLKTTGLFNQWDVHLISILVLSKMARREGTVPKLDQQQALGPTLCGSWEQVLNQPPVLVLQNRPPQASPMGFLIAHTHVGLFWDWIKSQWKTKSVQDRSGWFHLRILRFKRACNHKNSYCLFPSWNKNQAPRSVFSCLCSSLNSGRGVPFYRWDMGSQWSSNLSRALELVLGRAEFWPWVPQSLLPAPAVPTSSLLRVPLELVISSSWCRCWWSSLFTLPWVCEFCLSEQAGDTSRKRIMPFASLVVLSEPAQCLAQRSLKHLTGSPSQPPSVQSGVSQNYDCPAWKSPESHRPSWPLFPWNHT